MFPLETCIRQIQTIFFSFHLFLFLGRAYERTDGRTDRRTGARKDGRARRTDQWTGELADGRSHGRCLASTAYW